MGIKDTEKIQISVSPSWAADGWEQVLFNSALWPFPSRADTGVSKHQWAQKLDHSCWILSISPTQRAQSQMFFSCPSQSSFGTKTPQKSSFTDLGSNVFIKQWKWKRKRCWFQSPSSKLLAQVQICVPQCLANYHFNLKHWIFILIGPLLKDDRKIQSLAMSLKHHNYQGCDLHKQSAVAFWRIPLVFSFQFQESITPSWYSKTFIHLAVTFRHHLHGTFGMRFILPASITQSSSALLSEKYKCFMLHW